MARNIKGLVSYRGHHFDGRFVDKNSIILDLGSHLGEFSTEVSNTFGCQCYAVEALPSLYEKIKETHLLRKFNYAIYSTSQVIDFCVQDNLEANHIGKLSENYDGEVIQVNGICMNDFIDKYKLSKIDLLKIDIEGAEVDLFNSTSDDILRNIKQITVEFHDFIFDIEKEVKQIQKRLVSLGFMQVKFTITNNEDVLFINKNLCKLTTWDYINFKFIAKYRKALVRGMNKWIARNIINNSLIPRLK